MQAAQARAARSRRSSSAAPSAAPTRCTASCRSKIKGVDVIHGDLQQSARDRVMKAFRAGEARILVATDVVGRGIDVTSISHIINYDMPQSCDDYVHRVGRTGRMGREGMAFTFVTPEEGSELTRIEMLINRLLKRDEIEGFITVAQVAPPQASPAAARRAPPRRTRRRPAPTSPPSPPPRRRPANASPRRHRRGL